MSQPNTVNYSTEAYITVAIYLLHFAVGERREAPLDNLGEWHYLLP